MAIIELDSKEAWQLEHLIQSSCDPRQVRRAQALLWLTEDDSVEEIADRLRVDRRTIYNWVARFEERADLPVEQRVADGARSGRPPTACGIIDDLVAEIIDQDPREHGYQSTIWTADLLRRYLSAEHQIEVSTKSVSLAIDRLEIVWKRPRHQLALRELAWRQAKGGSNVASGPARARSS